MVLKLKDWSAAEKTLQIRGNQYAWGKALKDQSRFGTFQNLNFLLFGPCINTTWVLLGGGEVSCGVFEVISLCTKLVSQEEIGDCKYQGS